jgi:alanine racemase
MLKIRTHTLSEIEPVVGANFSGVSHKTVISEILIDSRKTSATDGVLFIAIEGSRHNGADYISELYEKGIRNFLVQQMPKDRFLFDQANFLIVENALSALQALAKYHRSLFDIPVIGITGSNGKTIVKEWLFQILQHSRKVIRSPKSYNSQVGVPISVLQMDEMHEIAVLEAGISQPGDMQVLEAMISPTIGVFTNIGQAHGRFFKDDQQKIEEKVKLFKSCERLIYCLDHMEVHKGIEASGIVSDKVFGWSAYHPSDLQILNINSVGAKTFIEALYEGGEIDIEIPFTDKASIENALHCWACLLCLGLSQDEIHKGMKLLVPVAMRLEMKSGINNCLLISDVYSSDLESFKIALDFVNQQQQSDKTTVILSDMLESTLSDKELYDEVATLLEKYEVGRLIGVGDKIKEHASEFKLPCQFYDDTEQFIKAINGILFENENILLKGARKFTFEDIGQFLSQKAHTTVLEVNLNALIHNFQYFKSLLKPEVKMMAMVKAFSYGTGSAEIASVLQFHRVDYLGVAYVDEGVELRKNGIVVPIMVMNPEESSFDQMLRYDLEPEIYSFQQLEQFAQLVRMQPSEKIFGIHIKVDTGMHRLGFVKDELSDLIKVLQTLSKIRVLSIFSHLAASDQPELAEFSESQFQAFDMAYEKLIEGIGYAPMRHILNSSGIENYANHQYEMVRVGIGMYGVSQKGSLRSVTKLKTRISQIKLIKEGESVGYNRSHIADKLTMIAILPIGYADGLNRKLGFNNGQVSIQGQLVPIIGAICMDMCFVDITGVKVKVGDEVEVFGDLPTISDVAKKLETIPYEVLTSVSRRVKRVYYQE